MNILRFFLLLFIALSFSGCIPELLLDEVDCSECYVPKPEEADLIIQVSQNALNSRIPIVVYKGLLEHQDTVAVDTLTQNEAYILVPVDQYYTVSAKYETAAGVVYAIDGDDLKTVKVTGQCDEVCWVIRGGILNVKLKYD